MNIEHLKELIIRKKSLHEDVDDLIMDEMLSLLQGLKCCELEETRHLVADLSHELHKHESLSIPILALFSLNNINKIIDIDGYFSPRSKREEVDGDAYIKYLEKCYLAFPNREIRIYSDNLNSVKIPAEIGFYNTNKALLDISITTPFVEGEIKEDLNMRMMSLIISHHYSYKYNLQHEFYIQLGSILSRLSIDGYPQLARDISEDALFCSFDKKELYYGFYVKFIMYTSQKNILDALLSLSLFIISFDKTTINHELKNKTLIELFILLRESGLYSVARKYYTDVINTLNIEEYESQKCQLAYFSLKILEEDEEVIVDIKNYLDKKMNDILGFHNGAIIPWFVLLHNLMKIFPDNDEKKYFHNAILKFEDSLDRKLVTQLKESLLGISGNLKNSLIKGMDNLSKTRNKDDYVYEVNSLMPLANNLIDESIKSKDIEGFLLAHKLKSDASILFKGELIEPINGMIKIEPNNYKSNRLNLDEYYNSMISQLEDDTSYFWIGFNDNKLYSLILNGKDLEYIGYVKPANLNDFDEWIDENIKKMGFNDNPSNDIFLPNEDVWKVEKNQIIESLPNLAIKDINFKEKVVIFPDVKMMGMPFNIIKVNDEILGEKHILSAPFSIDNYISKNISDDFYLWAPINQNDFAIAMAYSGVERVINKNEVRCDISDTPTANSDINIFISHGGKNNTVGFYGVYPGEDKTFNLDKLFGTGRVAILFICHSGSMVKNTYTNSNNTLITRLIESGYDAVISPSWSLHISIPSIWLPEFISGLKSNLNVSEANFKANEAVEKKFISPKASMAMHVFGNGALHL
ncbi:hypothetical protein [Pectobacterium carotovorum]|uniref:hypothetical protein n=1 Tax=Pectobacterium carotovorum TaxID=554 RepID=UPI000507B14E|nr:hypothetical protein [Pectobacterium carotovorum]KFW98006.1 hypothetical protein JV33_18985 [Pectobacterium carotovorum subsp. carotovorum]KML68946.1 hypothetical protein G032_13990 [Pectobacterium carotovorum subsp. carotovorum ICMP 5702]SHH46221.1 hypothetical protein SAMN05444147_11069 [Pectobacterium carotovorum]